MKKIAELTIEREESAKGGRYTMTLVQGRRTTMLAGVAWSEVKAEIKQIVPVGGDLDGHRLGPSPTSVEILKDAFAGFSDLVVVPEAFDKEGRSLGVLFRAPSYSQSRRDPDPTERRE